jgi:hypothetical protein
MNGHPTHPPNGTGQINESQHHLKQLVISTWMVGSPTANRPRQAPTLSTVEGI